MKGCGARKRSPQREHACVDGDGEGRGRPNDRTREEFLANAGLFVCGATQELGTPPTPRHFLRSWVLSQRRVQVKRRGGSVPLNPQDPARSLTPLVRARWGVNVIAPH